MDTLIPDPPVVSYWDASPALRELLTRKLPASEFAWAEPQMREMGARAACVGAPLAAIADRESPRLVSRPPAGEPINRVAYRPRYREMARIAYGSGLVAMTHDAGLATHAQSIHLVTF